MHVSNLMRLCCTGNQDLSGLEYQLGQLQLHAAQSQLGGVPIPLPFHMAMQLPPVQMPQLHDLQVCSYSYVCACCIATKYNCSSPNSGLIGMKARYNNQGQHHTPSDSSRLSNSSPSSSRLSNSSPSSSRLSNSSPSRLSNSSPSRLSNSSPSSSSSSSSSATAAAAAAAGSATAPTVLSVRLLWGCCTAYSAPTKRLV